MDHVAILSKKLHLLPKIINGEKTIESRWYKFKRTPYGVAKAGDTIYFKNAGEPVTVKATIKKVLFFNLNHTDVAEIMKDYAPAIGLNNTNPSKYRKFAYCSLIFLSNVQQINSFHINKAGYGMMAAWISIDDIHKIKQ